MGVRLGPIPITSPVQERIDAEARWFKDHLREIRHILAAVDEGVLPAETGHARILAVVIRGLGEGPA